MLVRSWSLLRWTLSLSDLVSEATDESGLEGEERAIADVLTVSPVDEAAVAAADLDSRNFEEDVNGNLERSLSGNDGEWGEIGGEDTLCTAH